MPNFFRAVLFFALILTIPFEAKAEDPLLQLSDLQYMGGFRLPQGEHGDANGFSFGGGPIAYNPLNGSLFVGSRTSKVAEVTIPSPVSESRAEEMPFSRVMQNLSDPLEGGLEDLNRISGASISGLLVYGNKLYGTAAIYYDATNAQTKSHYVRSLSLAEKSASPLYELKNPAGKAGFVSGWMAAVPAKWREALGGSAITGQCCIPIVSRTSWGPSAFAWNPEDVASGSAIPLLYYTGDHATLGSWSGSNPTYGGTTSMGGAVIVEGTRTLLFFGSNGTGPFCYGVGVETQAEAGEDKCYDPSNSYKGQHAYPYNYQVWAYDLNDLAAVKKGEKKPWEATPYGVWPLNLPTPDPHFTLGGAAYDPATGRIFISQMRADKDGYSARALIHVFKAGKVPASAAPAPVPAAAPPCSPCVTGAAAPSRPGYELSKNLRYGLRSDKDVFILQSALYAEGLLPDTARTGNFLNLTLAAVKNYQRKYGIFPVSGYVGPLTRAKLLGS